MKPIQLGITGGIGSGKSIICKIIEVLGIPVFYADAESKMLLETNPDIIRKVKELFGEGSYTSSGLPDRKYLSGVVFNNPDQLNKLNALLHPAVQQHYRNWVKQHEDKDMVAKEAAIMFESGSYKDMDFVIAVSSPQEVRIRRVMERDRKTENDILKIISRQLPEEEVIKRSDFVIVNDDRQLVIPRVLEIIDQIKNK
jgi:dephospho-CoA kinase